MDQYEDEIVVTFDESKYAKNMLKRLEKDLKKCKYDWQKEDLKKEIKRHKEYYNL